MTQNDFSASAWSPTYQTIARWSVASQVFGTDMDWKHENTISPILSALNQPRMRVSFESRQRKRTSRPRDHQGEILSQNLTVVDSILSSAPYCEKNQQRSSNVKSSQPKSHRFFLTTSPGALWLVISHLSTTYRYFSIIIQSESWTKISDRVTNYFIFSLHAKCQSNLFHNWNYNNNNANINSNMELLTAVLTWSAMVSWLRTCRSLYPPPTLTITTSLRLSLMCRLQ